MSETPRNDPMEYLKTLWGNMGFSLPGLLTPTVDTDELGKRIADLKAVEVWLKSNLSMLQMTIQGLEMQRATLHTLQQMSQAAQQTSEGESAANPFLNPAAWPMPWNLTGSAAPPAPPTETAPSVDTSTQASPRKKAKPAG